MIDIERTKFEQKGSFISGELLYLWKRMDLSASSCLLMHSKHILTRISECTSVKSSYLYLNVFPNFRKKDKTSLFYRRPPATAFYWLRWLETVPNTSILMGRYNHFLSLDATIMVSISCPTIGKQVVITFVTQ